MNSISLKVSCHHDAGMLGSSSGRCTPRVSIPKWSGAARHQKCHHDGSGPGDDGRFSEGLPQKTSLVRLKGLKMRIAPFSSSVRTMPSACHHGTKCRTDQTGLRSVTVQWTRRPSHRRRLPRAQRPHRYSDFSICETTVDPRGMLPLGPKITLGRLSNPRISIGVPGFRS